MNLDDVNRDPALQRTPLGRLSAVRYDGHVNIVADNGRTKPRIIHVVAPGGSVFDALYGKNAMVQRETRARYQRRDEEKKRAYELQKLSENADFERRLGRLFARKGDEARDVARRMLGWAG